MFVDTSGRNVESRVNEEVLHMLRSSSANTRFSLKWDRGNGEVERGVYIGKDNRGNPQFYFAPGVQVDQKLLGPYFISLNPYKSQGPQQT